MEAHTKLVDCPEHINHKALLYTDGHKDAGIWECPTSGLSGECEHEDYHLEDVENDVMSFNGHSTYETSIAVCDSCLQFLPQVQTV